MAKNKTICYDFFMIINSPVVAHRGASLYAPENTLSSLYKAAELGAKWVEFDVMLTQDNEAIIMHDFNLDRTTDGFGKVRNYTLDELKTLDAGAWFGDKFKQERIPSLDEWLAVCAELSLGVNIELKEVRRFAKKVAEKTHLALQKHWHADLPTPLISSSTPACLEAMFAIDPDYPLGLIVDTWHFGLLSRLKRLHCKTLNIHYRKISGRRLAKAKEAGFEVLTWTVNDAAEARRLLDLGVSAVFSDDPILLGK